MQLLTLAGEKAVASYDPFKDDPVFRCDPVAVHVSGRLRARRWKLSKTVRMSYASRWMDATGHSHQHEDDTPEWPEGVSLDIRIVARGRATHCHRDRKLLAGRAEQYVSSNESADKGVF
jgi:hypothetical protein